MTQNLQQKFSKTFENKTYEFSYLRFEENNQILITVTHDYEDLVSELPKKFQFTVDKNNNVTVMGLTNSQLAGAIVTTLQDLKHL